MVSASTVQAVSIGSKATQGNTVQSGERVCYAPAFDGSTRYFDLGAALGVTGDYRITALTLGATTDDEIAFFGNTANANGRGIVFNTGFIQFRAASDSTDPVAAPSGTFVFDQKQHFLEFERVGSSGTIRLDGRSAFTDPTGTGQLNLAVIGRTSSIFSLASVYDVRLYQAGTLTNYWPLVSDVEGQLNLTDVTGGATLTAVGFVAGIDPSNTIALPECPV